MRKIREKQLASLFVGRWQPFHKGHKTLIESVLKKKKPVVVAIRDTEISNQNPFSATERWTMIQKALNKHGELVKIVVIPDIDEICYGRDVGYGIRKIDLDEKTENVYGTSIRAKKDKRFPIIWFTGQSGSGKTTLANLLKKEIGGVVLDGDEMRKSISEKAGYGKQDRHDHNLRVARLAKVLSKDNLVIVAVIAPFEKSRKEITEMIDPIWVYVKRNLPKDKNRPYEIPKNPHITLDVEKLSSKEKISSIVEFVENFNKSNKQKNVNH